MLRPKPRPLSAQQLKVYKDFKVMPMGTAKRLNVESLTIAVWSPFILVKQLQSGGGLALDMSSCI